MGQETVFFQSFQIKGKDFLNAGSVSVKIKRILKEIGVKQEVVYRTSICCYEAEMNTIMYANKGTLDFSVNPEEVIVVLTDEGPGIQNIELAMQEGYSTATEEMREMGFGAGMGLPNIKKNSDVFNIESKINKGTKLYFKIYLN
jgi:anti-sigma regulatory factor (Ser/Thr protein kinase)